MKGEVEAIVAEVFDLDEAEVKDDLTPETVDGWDSLAHLRLVTTVEQELGIKFSMNEVESIDSVGKLKEYVQQRVAES